MARMFTTFILLIFSFASVCQEPTTYVTGLDKWHRQREQDLKAPGGWLNLEGLFWLHPGRNNFGSAAGNDIIYMHPEMPAHAGEFILEGKEVIWVSHTGTSVLVSGQNRTQATIFNLDSTRNPAVQLGPFSWTIIKREEKIGVRFRNLNSKAIQSFTGIERFAVDSSWQVTASLVSPVADRIAVTNVLGQTNLEKSPGKLKFIISGISYTLDALDQGSDELLIVFGDVTNGSETYPAGRFIYVKKPGADGHTEIDFNKAINPPCAFTDYATCPIPPRQNVLPIAVTAGEKNFGKLVNSE